MDMKVSSNNINMVEHIVHYYLDTIKNTRGSINKINLSVEMFNIIYDNINYFKNNNIFMATLYTTLKKLKNEITDIDCNLELEEWCDIYNKLIKYKKDNL
jgi:hypothetical protein